jgi:hypothetical protein
MLSSHTLTLQNKISIKVKHWKQGQVQKFQITMITFQRMT